MATLNLLVALRLRLLDCSCRRLGRARRGWRNAHCWSRLNGGQSNAAYPAAPAQRPALRCTRAGGDGGEDQGLGSHLGRASRLGGTFADEEFEMLAAPALLGGRGRAWIAIARVTIFKTHCLRAAGAPPLDSDRPSRTGAAMSRHRS
jgi:hypothetical protein